jgi:integrase
MARLELVDIHNYWGMLVAAEKRLHNPLSERNRELILEFEKKLISKGLSTPSIAKYVGTLTKIGGILGKDFDAATKRDIEDLVFKIERSDRSPWTKHTYKVILKRFYKWLKGGDEEYPEEVKWIKTTLKARDELLPEDLLTEEEVMRLVEACGNPMDKAFIMCFVSVIGG